MSAEFRQATEDDLAELFRKVEPILTTEESRRPLPWSWENADLIPFRVLETRDVLVQVAQRPAHCNRGRWIVYAEGKTHQTTLDAADMFPRYYFHEDCLNAEIREWLRLRGQIDENGELIR